MAMPKRTRQHQLSEQSERAFSGALGATLKYHERPQLEYGIDGDVEHFAHDGSATGLHFFVQLKGTDEPDLSRALAEPIPVETANYYRRASMPVLMVRYHAHTRALYGRWFHQYDPYYGRGGTKTLTFRWQASDLFDVDTPARLAAEASAFYEIRKAAIRLPLQLYVVYDNSLGFEESELRIAVRELVAERRDVLKLANGPPPPGAVSVEVRTDAICAHLGSVTASTLHLPKTPDEDFEAEQAALEALVQISLALERVGHDALAARLAATYLPRSALASNLDVAFALAAAMGRSDRIGEALALSEELDDPDAPGRAESGFVFGLAALLTSDRLSPRDATEYEAVLQRRIERRRATRPREAGVAAMNLATYLRSRSRHDEAIARYQEAVELDSGYEQRAHYFFELAGSLFLARRFEDSAIAYQRAIELGTDQPDAVALYADALLYAGEYRRAHTELSAYLSTEAAECDDGEYRLKAFAVAYLLERLGIERQPRSTEDALRVKGGKNPTDARGWEQLSFAQLQRDALWGSAWLNLAVCDRAAGRPEDGLCCDVLSTLLMPQDHEAWRNAIFAAVEAQELDLVTDLLVVGQRTAGPPLTRYLIEQVKALPDPVRTAFLGIIDDTLAKTHERLRRPVSLRMLSEDGVIEHSLELPASPAASPPDSPG